MKVVLANPPWRKHGRLGVRAGSRWPFTRPEEKLDYMPFPFFLAYATAVLEKDGVDVTLIDAIAEELDDSAFLGRVSELAPDLVVIETATPSVDADMDMARRLREETDVPLAVCGPHVSAVGESFMKEVSCVDYLMFGEYEYTLRDLVRALQGEAGSLGSVQGLIYRAESGQIVSSESRPLIGNLDELPWPARHQLPMLNYCDAFSGIPQPGLQIWSSRGCPFRCIFCMWPQVMYQSTKYRVRSAGDVIDEIEWCLRRWPFKSVYFDDDTFNISKSHVLSICEEMRKRGLSVPWGAMARADTADYEMLEAMAGAGMYSIKYGIESGDQVVLDSCGKDLDLKKVVEIVRLTEKFGIKTHVTFTIGLPGETGRTVRKSLKLSKKLNPETAQFSITVPFPGTVYYDMVREKGHLQARSWSEYDGAGFAALRTEHLTSGELQDLYMWARDEWEKFYYRREVLRRIRRNPLLYVTKLVRHPLLFLRSIFRFILWNRC